MGRRRGWVNCTKGLCTWKAKGAAGGKPLLAQITSELKGFGT